MENKKFIRNLEDLPVKEQEQIKVGLMRQIVGDIDIKKEDNPDGLKQYLESEISGADKAMNTMILESRREGARLETISFIYVWNKERLKILKSELAELNGTGKPQQTGKPVGDGACVPKWFSNKPYWNVMISGAIELGLLEHDGTGGYIWLESDKLFGYFVREISNMFELKVNDKYQWGKFIDFIHNKNGNDKEMVASAKHVSDYCNVNDSKIVEELLRQVRTEKAKQYKRI